MWLADNVSGHYKRATMIGVTIALANNSGILVGQVFTAQTAPRYLEGLKVSLGMQSWPCPFADCLGTVTASFMSVITLASGMYRVNKKRERLLDKALAEGGPIPDQPEKGDYNPHFRYSL